MKETKIGTHNGTFHADDVFSIALLSSLMDGEVVRTRDPDVLERCQFLVDVGGEYDGHSRFDHHQVGGGGERANGIPYAGFGLVWKHFGREWLQEHYPMLAGYDDGPSWLAVWFYVDCQLVQGIDAGDCGYTLAEWKGDIRPMTMSGLISGMNPRWNEKRDPDEAFSRAMNVAGEILAQVVEEAIAWAEAEQVVEEAIRESRKGQSKVMVLKRGGVPWMEHLFSSEEKHSEALLYVIFPTTEGNPNWMVQCVPDALGSFGKRKALPESWAGLRGEELANECGFKSAVFCHIGRFICGADSFSDAVGMAQTAIEA